MAEFPRFYCKPKKMMVGYKIRIWFQEAKGEEGKLMVEEWSMAPSIGYLTVYKIAKRHGLNPKDDWEVVTDINYD